MSAPSTADKALEMRLRRWAAGQGLTLAKSRRRTPGAIGAGRWHLTDGRGRPALGGPHGVASLQEVEAYLTRPDAVAS